jgi:hypothetical protein
MCIQGHAGERSSKGIFLLPCAEGRRGGKSWKQKLVHHLREPWAIIEARQTGLQSPTGWLAKFSHDVGNIVDAPNRAPCPPSHLDPAKHRFAAAHRGTLADLDCSAVDCHHGDA